MPPRDPEPPGPGNLVAAASVAPELVMEVAQMGESADRTRPDVMGGPQPAEERTDVMGGPEPDEQDADVMGGAQPAEERTDVMGGPEPAEEDADVMGGPQRSTDVMGSGTGERRD